MGLDTNVDNGGSVVTSYQLEVNQGTPGSSFVPVTTYVSGSLSHTVSISNDNLVAGRFYIFRWYAVNAFGSGERSNELTVAFSAYPLATPAINKIMSLSSKTSISLTWNPVAAGAAPGGDILCYILVAKDILNGTVWTPFNGVALGARDQTKFTVQHLTPGREYKFTVTAYNFNGAGATSNEFTYLSCIVPENFEAPWRVFTTKTTIGIQWK